MKFVGHVKLKKGGTGFAKAIKAGKTTALEAVKIGVLEIHGAAVRGIMKVSPGGAQVRYNPKRVRIASKPGDPPNVDFGVFVKSVQFNIDEKELKGQVGSNDKRAPAFEFGTKNMEPRPWLSPAWQKSQKKIKDLFKMLRFKIG